jgi:hypothetical protein
MVENRLFSFLPPPGWGVESNAETRKVTLKAPDQSATISIIFYADPLIAPPLAEADLLRAWVQGHYPETTLTREFSCVVGGTNGAAFDLEKAANSTGRFAIRLAFVALKGSIFEFKLVARTGDFARHQGTLNNLLSSFKEATAGRSP